LASREAPSARRTLPQRATQSVLVSAALPRGASGPAALSLGTTGPSGRGRRTASATMSLAATLFGSTANAKSLSLADRSEGVFEGGDRPTTWDRGLRVSVVAALTSSIRRRRSRGDRVRGKGRRRSAIQHPVLSTRCVAPRVVFDRRAGSDRCVVADLSESRWRRTVDFYTLAQGRSSAQRIDRGTSVDCRRLPLTAAEGERRRERCDRVPRGRCVLCTRTLIERELAEGASSLGGSKVARAAGTENELAHDRDDCRSRPGGFATALRRTLRRCRW
jgi:hypothetical protein